MIDWTEYTREVVFNQKKEDGSLLLTDFIRDYKNVFKPVEVNIGCLSCLNQYYDKLINYITKMGTKTPEKCLFKLKEKYNGVRLGFNTNLLIHNGNITDELAIRLLKEHPRGELLFTIIPDSYEPNAIDEHLKLSELREKYPNIKAISKANFLTKVDELITDQESEDNTNGASNEEE